MLNFTVNGKPFTPENLEQVLVQQLVEELREQLGSIRDPVTGEFPMVAITGDDLSSLQVNVEGSPELLELVRARLEDSTEASPSEAAVASSMRQSEPPKAFLSFAYEDQDLAQQIATTLQAAGIETWFADWCMHAGDSLRQKIDEGLDECTHFVVLLTPRSIGKPWVNLEMDAGLVRRVQGAAKFIPLRCELPTSSLSPLLQSMRSPSVDPCTVDISELVSDIHGLTKKPPLGTAPAVKRDSSRLASRLSPAAAAVARLFIEGSAHGLDFDPQLKYDEVRSRAALSEEDFRDAMHELRVHLVNHFDSEVTPKESLFASFDDLWMPWKPADDALTVASHMVNDPAFPELVADIGAKLGWERRRLNPALAFLCIRGLVEDTRYLNNAEWLAHWVSKTDATRRFVKSRS